MTTRSILHLLLASSITLTFVGCGQNNDDLNSNNPFVVPAEDAKPDTGHQDESMDVEEDFGTVGDDLGNPDASNANPESEALIETWPLHNRIAATDISSSEEDGVWTATIDASAGGFMAAAQNPFIYLDMDTGQKVEITDHQAVRSDATWELGLRRSSLFINGGDGGIGSVGIAKITGIAFEDVGVADVPDDILFMTENPVNQEGEVLPAPSGVGSVETVFERLNRETSSGSWYGYEGGVSVIDGHVYIVRETNENKRYKMEFVSWTSGVFTIKWAQL